MLTYFIGYFVIGFSFSVIVGIYIREKRRKKINKKWGKHIEELENTRKKRRADSTENDR